MNKKTKKLTLSGIMVALATILSFITIYRLPYGGSVTLLSMLPILLVGYIYGTGWGITTGIIYGIVQSVFGAVTSSAFAGLSFINIILVLTLDYVIAFGFLGLSGIFKNKIKDDTVSFGLGVFVSTVLRYLTHILSGYIVYGSYSEWFFSQNNVPFGQTILNEYSGKMLSLTYSVIYNATYMIPEIIISVIAGICIIKLPQIIELCKNK